MTTTVLSLDDTLQLVQRIGHDRLMDEMIAGLTRAFQTFGHDSIQLPPRDGFHYSTPTTGLIEWMPVMEQGRQATIKVVGYHPENPRQRGLPTILGTISAYDTTTGHLVGIVDGTFLTALRTGAASAVASRYLAPVNAASLGLIGAGAQAITQLHALSREFRLTRVLFHDADVDAELSFPDRAGTLDLHGTEFIAATAEEVVSESDILCTATSTAVGAPPLFTDVDTRPWLHVNAAGSDFEGKVELDPSFLRESLVVPDLKEQAVLQGECQQLTGDEIGPELAYVVQHPDEFVEARSRRTVFDSTGIALEDHVALNLILSMADELGLGQRIQIENFSDDPKNPYGFLFEPVPAG